MRPRSLLSTNAALLVALAFASIAHAAPAAPRLATPERVTASEELQWSIPLGLLNPNPAGIYVDSLFAVIEDRDPGTTQSPRTTHMDLQVLARLLPNVAAQDSGLVVFVGPATAESAQVGFTIQGHHADGTRFKVSSSTLAQPGPQSRAHPSVFVTAGGRKVETVWVESPAAHEGALPAVLMIHDDASHARRMIAQARVIANRGYHVMLVSLPGYGRSDGPVDFAGPATVDAVSAAFDAMKSHPGVTADRAGVWGFGLGATVATLLAGHRGDIAAVIAQGGLYDLAAISRETAVPGLSQRIAAAAGRDSSAWHARSPAASPERLQAPIFVLHGGRDTVAPMAQAKAFVAALQAAGKQVESVFVETAGHDVLGVEAMRTTRTYLAQKLKE